MTLPYIIRCKCPFLRSNHNHSNNKVMKQQYIFLPLRKQAKTNCKHVIWVSIIGKNGLVYPQY